MRTLILALVAGLMIAPARVQTHTSWDGIWNGSRGGLTAAKIIIGGGRVVEYDYRGTPQKVGETTIWGDTLAFGRPPSFDITLTRTGATTASAHYHGPGGEGDALLTRQ